MFHLLLILFLLIATPCLVIALAIWLGGPIQPKPMKSVSEPFQSADFSGLPDIQRYSARDGAALAYRIYPLGENPRDISIVLIHGSSSHSGRIHPLAKKLAQSGYKVFSLDMRGHGESGTRGQIDYIGQLEEDLEDFLNTVHPPGKRILAGFSAGGGFTLRFAADHRSHFFDGYLLLAPFLSSEASTYRPSSGGWVSIGMARIIGLMILNRLGVTFFNYLPVTNFALSPEVKPFLSPSYSFSLAVNFRPHLNYKADIASVNKPMTVLIGEKDDQFFSGRFAAEFEISKIPIKVSIIPELGHAEMVLSPIAFRHILSEIALLENLP
ncbi:MAG: Alpha/beta hydrolase family protein [Betaproteobacteria bacterium ADurb.Bin341]|nr:MAG: Alpha/beta hydrolase family protein [Betaproteobacteria bacterium ADurb.Bin341]